jgi:hypothetical protein
VVAGLGITAGCFVHVFAAALGVSALLAASATAFTALKWLGAAYLLWIGFAAAGAPGAETQDLRRWRVAAAGAVARRVPGRLLDQRAEPEGRDLLPGLRAAVHRARHHRQGGRVPAAGHLFNINSVPINSGWALAAAWMARREAVQRGMRWLDRVAGAMFVAFGLRLALADNPTLDEESPMPITPQEALQRTIEHREIFHDEMLKVVRLIMSGELSPVMTAALITGLRVKKETIGEITAAAEVMREFSTKVHVADKTHLVDIVGTGGDGSHTFNISTCSMFVAAAAGAKVSKHGGRSVSSKSGSADVLEALGLNINLSPEPSRAACRRSASASCSRPTTTRR